MIHLTLQQLQYLIAIAENNSINQAAQSLFVSQSSISKAVKQLEEELGFALLDRSYRGISFTSRGLDFLRDSYTLMEQFNFLKTHYLTQPDTSFTFSVSSQRYIFVIEAISRMVNLLGPCNYSINLREHRTSEIINDVVTHKSAIGFIYYYHINEEFIKRELLRFNLEFHPFCEAIPHVYISKTHPLAQEGFVSQSMLDQYPYVCYDLDTDSANFAEEIFSPNHPKQVIYVTDRSSMFNIIRHTESYTLGSGLLLDGYVDDDITVRPLDLSAMSTMQIGWIKLQGQELDAESSQFIQFCKEAFAKCTTN